MAGNSSGWRYNQESVETKTFTWRLRPQVIQAPGDPSSKNTKISGTSGSSASRLVTSSLRQTHSATSLSTQFQTGSEQVSNFLRYQEFEVEAGQSLGLHSMWSFFLVSCGSSLPTQWSSTNISTSAASSSSPPHPPNSDFVGLFLRKVLKPSKNSEPGYTPAARNDELVARYKIEILDRDGEVLYTKDCEADSRENLEVGYWDWKKITTVSKLQAPKGKPQGRDSLDDEFLLLLRVSFTMVNRRKSVLVKAKTNQLSPEEVVSAREAGVTFLSLVDNPKGSSPDIVVEIPNRRKFNVHKSVLMGRSPVLSKTLVLERTKKVIRVDDISANTMELILRHMYTGQLEEEWTTNPVTATELIYASGKYGLIALKEYCNKHLVRAANKNNCYKLMEVAQLHNLDKAAEDLMSYVSEGITSTSNSRKPSQESVQSK